MTYSSSDTLAVTMAFSPSVMAVAEARSGGQPIMPTPQPIMPTPIEGSAFEEAVEIAEEFLQRNPDGTLTLNMPGRVIRTIGEDVYAQLQAGLARANEKVSGGYLKFDENFDAYVTERYLDRVKLPAQRAGHLSGRTIIGSWLPPITPANRCHSSPFKERGILV